MRKLICSSFNKGNNVRASQGMICVSNIYTIKLKLRGGGFGEGEMTFHLRCLASVPALPRGGAPIPNIQ